MERIIKLLIIILFCAIITINPSVAIDEQINLSTLITAQNVSFENCYKVFNTDNISLFYLTIASINANRFKIDEIQSHSGYILFTAVNKQFLATVSNVNTNQAMLKITPVDGNYYFQPGIVSNIFKYIQNNGNQKPVNLNFN